MVGTPNEQVAWDSEFFASAGVKVIGSRLTADESFAAFAVKLQSTGEEWPSVHLRLLAYDSSDLLVSDTWLELTTGLQPDVRDAMDAIFGEVHRVELVLTAPAFGPDSIGDEGDVAIEIPRALPRLMEDSESETRLTKRVIGEQLLRLVNGEPEHDRVLAEVASAIRREPATPYLAAPSNPWSWPRQEWSDWSESVVAILNGVPGNLFRRLQFTTDQELKIRAEVSGRDGEFRVMVIDRRGLVEGLAALEWSAEPLPASASIIWHHDYVMNFAEGAVDRLAQALALAVRMPSPRSITVHALTFS